MFEEATDGQTKYCPMCEEKQRRIDDLEKQNKTLLNEVEITSNQYEQVVKQNKELQRELNSLKRG